MSRALNSIIKLPECENIWLIFLLLHFLLHPLLVTGFLPAIYLYFDTKLYMGIAILS